MILPEALMESLRSPGSGSLVRPYLLRYSLSVKVLLCVS